MSLSQMVGNLRHGNDSKSDRSQSDASSYAEVDAVVEGKFAAKAAA